MIYFKIRDKVKNHFYFKYEMKHIKSRFGFCGSNVVVSPNCIIAGHDHIYIDDNTYIGPECLIYSTVAKLHIGKNVTLGPRVSIVTGDHRFDVVGSYINENKIKLPDNDKDVVIEDDCWIGMNVNIFKGVRIGKGSVVAGGAVVTKDIPPYSIFIERNKIYSRFTPEQIIEHERILVEKEK